VTHLRQLTMNELQRRNYSQSTARCQSVGITPWTRSAACNRPRRAASFGRRPTHVRAAQSRLVDVVTHKVPFLNSAFPVPDQNPELH